MAVQRSSKEKLSQIRKGRLESLTNWSWDPHNENWEKSFKQVEEFIRTEGHAKIPQSYISSDSCKLGRWVVKQRVAKNKMSQDRKERLESLPGWSWDILTDMWEEGFNLLKAFVDKEGHCKVPSSFTTSSGYKLGNWVGAQRSKKEILSQNCIKLLESLPGWIWDAMKEKWEDGFRRLEAFVHKEGHSRVPQSYKLPDGYNLGLWVSSQRIAKNKLAPDRKKRLENIIGWSWVARSDRWEEGFKHLEIYYLAEGHAKVAHTYVSQDGYKLGVWVASQRRNAAILSEDKINRLESFLGWSWNPFADKFENGISQLNEFVKNEGHAIVPKSFVTADGFPLWSWVNRQRKKRDELTQERTDRLEAIAGWSWETVGKRRSRKH